MEIAIDVSPLKSGHSVRGVGFYLKYLQESLLEIDQENNYTFFSDYRLLNVIPDIVHFPYFDPYFITLPLYKKYKTVITIHDLTPLVFPEAFPSGMKGKLRLQIQKRLAKQSNAIITDSEASKKDIERIMNINTKKIHVIYLAAASEYVQVNDQVALNAVKKKYNLPDEFLLYVGDVTWNKNLVRLVNAVKKTSIPMVMVGKALASNDYNRENPWNKDLVIVQELCLNDEQIKILGFVTTDDLVAIYNLATVFLMPSLYEGFGLPVLEAMQCGTPVITSDKGSLPEVAGNAAYIVDAYDENSIFEGIVTVVNNKNLQAEMKEKGFRQAKKFDWKMTAERTKEVYEEVSR
jgi:glycosyltransferase involved in cell wall biosynthesis